MSNNKQILQGHAVRDRILMYIMQYTTEHGYPPSVREIGENVGLKSTSSVHSHLEKMETEGLIKRDPSMPRKITITANEYINSIRSVRMIPVVICPTRKNVFAKDNICGFYPYNGTLDLTELGVYVVKQQDLAVPIFMKGDILIFRPGPASEESEKEVYKYGIYKINDTIWITDQKEKDESKRVASVISCIREISCREHAEGTGWPNNASGAHKEVTYPFYDNGKPILRIP